MNLTKREKFKAYFEPFGLKLIETYKQENEADFAIFSERWSLDYGLILRTYADDDLENLGEISIDLESVHRLYFTHDRELNLNGIRFMQQFLKFELMGLTEGEGVTYALSFNFKDTIVTATDSQYGEIPNGNCSAVFTLLQGLKKGDRDWNNMIAAGFTEMETLNVSHITYIEAFKKKNPEYTLHFDETLQFYHLFLEEVENESDFAMDAIAEKLTKELSGIEGVGEVKIVPMNADNLPDGLLDTLKGVFSDLSGTGKEPSTAKVFTAKDVKPS